TLAPRQKTGIARTALLATCLTWLQAGRPNHHETGLMSPEAPRVKGAVEKAIPLVNVTDWRIHDLRRTVATGMQRLGVSLQVTEAVLGHTSGSRGGIVGVLGGALAAPVAAYIAKTIPDRRLMLLVGAIIILYPKSLTYVGLTAPRILA